MRESFRIPCRWVFTFIFCSSCVQLGLSQQNVLTYHNDNGRSGQYVNETILTPAKVSQSQFGKIVGYDVDGFVVGQPLYLQNVVVPGMGAHNIVLVGTLHDSLYAFDADATSLSAPLWQVSFINPAAGVTTVPAAEAGCNNVTKFTEQGIIGTPVIDPGSETIYLVAKTKENGRYVQRLHALDAGTGQEKFGGPVVIGASVFGGGDGSSTVTFDPLGEMSRTGLLLVNNIVYLSFGANGCKQVHNHGWILAYDARSLQQLGVFNTTPNTNNGGIWQGGSGPAADGDGNIYVETADAIFDVNTGGNDYGNSILKLSLNDSGLVLADYFTPMNQSSLNDLDFDLGAVGPIVVPDQTGAAHPRLVIGSGKDETIYVMDRGNLGGYNSTVDQIVQEVSPNSTRARYGVPTYWNGRLYFEQLNTSIIAYSLSNGVLSSSPVSQTSVGFARPNPSSISALGTASGILWLVTSATAGSTLRAFDALNLATELYDSDQAGSRDTLGLAAHFATPTIANGRVYVGTQSQLVVYGLLGTAPSLTLSPTSLSFPSQTVNTTSNAQTVSLSNTGTAPLNVSGLQISGDFAQTNNCTANIAVGSSCSIIVTFTPTADGSRNGMITITDNASGSPHTVSLVGTGVLASTATTLSSSQNPASFAQSVTFSVLVTASSATPSGNVTVFDGSNPIGTKILDGQGRATFTTAPSIGSHSIVAVYAGDAASSGSSSSPLTQIVNPSATTTIVTSSSNPSSVNQTITFSATVTGQFGGTPTGSITFKSGTVSLGRVAMSGGSASLNQVFTTTGIRSITAVYSSDANFSGSTSAVLSQSVTAAPTTATVGSSLNPANYGDAIVFTAVVSSPYGTPTGAVSFRSGTAGLGTAALTNGIATLTVTTLSAGTKSITANYNGSQAFSASVSPALNQVVSRLNTATLVASSQNPSTVGQTVTFTATVNSSFGTPTGIVTFKNGSTVIGTVALVGGSASLATSSLTAGSSSISATFVQSGNYNGSTGTITQQVR